MVTKIKVYSWICKKYTKLLNLTRNFLNFDQIFWNFLQTVFEHKLFELGIQIKSNVHPPNRANILQLKPQAQNSKSNIQFHTPT